MTVFLCGAEECKQTEAGVCTDVSSREARNQFLAYHLASIPRSSNCVFQRTSCGEFGDSGASHQTG